MVVTSSSMASIDQENRWLHADADLISSHGVHYRVNYVGSVDVLCSMKSLDFDHRTQVARESIRLVCSATGVTVKDRRKSNESSTEQPMIGSQANLTHSRTPIELIINTEALTLKRIHDGQMMYSHRMEGISFASAGEHETKDYIAYVAKDNLNRRACHVLLCQENESLDVITTIGQAFELRYNEYLRSQQPTESTTKPIEPERTLPKNEENHHEILPAVPTPQHQDQSRQGKWNTMKTSDVYKEKWFHGKISREEAETLLSYTGDFLVRESAKIPGQYILSGRAKDQYKHLLLVDPDGVIRTRDYEFDSIQHLVAYHQSGNIPIVSVDSELPLKSPILRKN